MTDKIHGSFRTMTPEQRSARSRAASRASWDATPDRSARTAPGRQAFRDSFTSDEERSAHYRRMAERSAEVRRANAAARRRQQTPGETR